MASEFTAALESALAELAQGERGKAAVVADPWGHIYHASYYKGIFWRVLYALFSHVLPAGYPLKALLSALTRCEALFNRQMRHTAAAAASYEAYLSEASLKAPASQENYLLARKTLLRWGELCCNLKAVRNNSLYKRFFPIDPRIHSKIKRCLAIVELEGLFNKPLPIDALSAALQGRETGDNKKEELHTFCTALNTLQAKEAAEGRKELIRPLHNALSALVYLQSAGSSQSNESSWDHRICTAQFEAHLIQSGCSVFSEAEKKVCRHRALLQAGATVPVAGDKQIVLGQRLPGAGTAAAAAPPRQQRGDEQDRFVVFSLPNDPNRVFLAANNRAAAALEAYNCRRSSSLLPARAIDTSITTPAWAALAERLYNTLFSTAWQSMSSVTAHDLHRLKPLIQLARQWLHHKQQPFPLSIDNLMVDSNNNLRSLKATQTKPFDFNSIEDFLRDFSRGHEHIFAHLMKEISMDEEPIAQFYSDVIKQSLTGELQDCKTMAATWHITSAEVLARAESLKIEALALRNTLFETISAGKKWGETHRKDIKKKLNTLFVDKHKVWGIRSMLPTSFKSRLSAIVSANKSELTKLPHSIAKNFHLAHFPACSKSDNIFQ